MRTTGEKEFARSQQVIFNFLLLYGLLLTCVPILLYPAETIIRGMSQIIHSPSNLISDYVEIAGAGAALTNSGLLTLLSLFILRKYRHSFCPLTIPIVMMLSGFSFLAKI